jgi:hypothetical protein
LSALLAAGLGEQQAIGATLVLTTYVVGFALERHAATVELEPIEADAGRRQQFRAIASRRCNDWLPWSNDPDRSAASRQHSP